MSGIRRCHCARTVICAHRGLSEVCPENTLPAFASAMAAGADEIEFDLRLSRDGVPVVCHDETVDRTCVGTGRISDLTWPAIRKLDAGAKLGPAWRGVGIPCFEDMLNLAGGRIMMNVHIYETDSRGTLVRIACNMIRARRLSGRAYIAGDELVLKAARACAPRIHRACLHAANDPAEQIRTALKYSCRRIQFCRDFVGETHVRAACEAGLVCNLFWSDEIKDAIGFARMGIDVILTNRAHQLIADGARDFRQGD